MTQLYIPEQLNLQNYILKTSKPIYTNTTAIICCSIVQVSATGYHHCHRVSTHLQLINIIIIILHLKLLGL
jgi:hypothetical protein